jgi:hypothetical protein
LSKVFVDTAAWIALINSRDNLHIQVKQVRYKLRQQNAVLVTTKFVLLEAADAFCDSFTRMQAVSFIDGLESLAILQIISIERSLFTEGWLLYKQRPDKDWGLTVLLL